MTKSIQTRLIFLIVGVLIFVIITSCSANAQYKQIKIPLNNEDGAPFYKEGGFIYLDGFEVDEAENFYFLGGEKATLACFSGAEPKFRRRYDEFSSSQIYLLNGKIFLFDILYKKNNLITLDILNGDILRKLDGIINNTVNSFVFRDSSLIIRVFDDKKTIDMSTQLGFVQFDLNGKFIKQVDNLYNLPKVLYSKESERHGNHFLGSWNNNFFYCNYDIDTKSYKFTMNDADGKLLNTKNIDKIFFGKVFFGHPYEYERFRNGNIYFLSRDEKYAIITVLPIKELFNLN